jgi:hypothetical protein
MKALVQIAESMSALDHLQSEPKIPNPASQEELSGMVQCARLHYGASTGRLRGSGILAACNGMSVRVEAWVFGAFLSISSAAAAKSVTDFSSALGGRALWFRTTSS